MQATVHRVTEAPTQVTRNGNALPEQADRTTLVQEGGWLYDADRHRLHVHWRGATDAAHRVVATGIRVGVEE